MVEWFVAHPLLKHCSSIIASMRWCARSWNVCLLLGEVIAGCMSASLISEAGLNWAYIEPTVVQIQTSKQTAISTVSVYPFLPDKTK